MTNDGIFVRNLSPPCWKDTYMMDYPGYPLVKAGARFCWASSLEVYQPRSRPPCGVDRWLWREQKGQRQSRSGLR